MPAAPKFRIGAGEIGRLKVIDQIDAQQLGRPHSDGGAAGEIAVQLHTEQQRGHNQKPAIKAVFQRVYGIYKDGRTVRNDNFEEVPPNQQQYAVPQMIKLQLLGCMELGKQTFAPADGTRRQLREKGHKQCDLQQAFSAGSPR